MSNKIESLTEEQTALMPEYAKKWSEIALSTKRVTWDEANEVVGPFRELIKMKTDVPLVLAENPIESWVLCALFELGVKVEDLQTEMAGVFDGNKKNWEIPEATTPYQVTTDLAGTFSFYDYMLEVVKVPISDELYKKFDVWRNTSKVWGIYPLEGLTVVCQNPITIKINDKNQRHCDGGPAIAFGGLGDFTIYALNGVDVPEYLAVTPSHQIDINLYNKETNADVKAEFVRKVGIERFLEQGKKLDSYENYDQEDASWWWKSEYELWDMVSMFPSLQSAPYLKMKNQTTDVWHMEGVSPKCQKLPEAIKERFGGRDMRIVNVA